MAYPNTQTDFMNWGQQNNLMGNVQQNSQNLLSGVDSNALSYMNGMGEQPGGGGSPGFSLWGGTDENGIKTNSGMSLGLGAAQGLFNGWLGMKKLGMAKDQLRENKRQFNMNWGAQKKTTNNQIYNAEVVRNGSANPANNQDMGAYMDKWGIK